MSIHLSIHDVRTYARPQKVFDFNEIWLVGTGRQVMHNGMQYDPIQGQGHEPFKVRNPLFSKAISSVTYHGSWQLTTDSQTRAQYLNFYRPGF